jgi:Ca2+-binding EF-hand superfamily protein
VKARVREIMKQNDKDENGSLDWGEFLDIMRRTVRRHLRPSITVEPNEPRAWGVGGCVSR